MEVASKFAWHLPGCPGIWCPTAAGFVPGPAYTKTTDKEFDFLSEGQQILIYRSTFAEKKGGKVNSKNT